jgi:hypothetical protein
MNFLCRLAHSICVVCPAQGKAKPELLLRRSHWCFVSACEPSILIYLDRTVVLSFSHRGWVGFSYTVNFRTRRAAARECLRLFYNEAQPGR